MKLKHIAAVLLIIILYLAAGRDDLAIAQQDNKHWCDNVKAKIWYSSQDEYTQRCGGE